MPSETNQQEWYAQLRKPRWAPKPQLFGTVWSALYPIIFGSFGYTIYKMFYGSIPKALLVPIAVNLVANALFAPLQFRLKRNDLALYDMLIVVGSLIWFIAMIWPLSLVIALVQLPYLVWVLFATALQITIVRLNGHRPAAV